MDSAMIGKISKAQQYAQEPERMTLQSFTVLFNGKHDTYTMSFEHGKWHCGCDFFAQRGVCSHTMAAEKVLVKTGMTVEQPTDLVAV
jgi:hypothetical protein